MPVTLKTMQQERFEKEVYVLFYQKVHIESVKSETPKRKSKIEVTSTSKNWILSEGESMDPEQDPDDPDDPDVSFIKRRLIMDSSKAVQWEVSEGTPGTPMKTPQRKKKKPQKRREKKPQDEQAVEYVNGVKVVYIRCIVCYELCKENMSEKDFQFFTGLSKLNFDSLFTLIDGEDGIMKLKYTYGMRTPRTRRAARKEAIKISARSRLLLVLLRMRRGIPVRDLAYLFGISSGYAAFIFFAVLRKICRTFKSMEKTMFLTREQQKNRPQPFKAFPDVRVILDGVEFKIQAPSNYEQQGNTYSLYKKMNTAKYIIGISCFGAAMFVSAGFEGSKSDKEILKESGLLNWLVKGDAVMVDRGFDIEADLLEIGVKTIKPPSRSKGDSITPSEQLFASAVAQARIYVEHAIGKIKEYRLLRFTIPLNMRGILNDLVYVAAYFTNFSDRAIKPRAKKKAV